MGVAMIWAMCGLRMYAGAAGTARKLKVPSCGVRAEGTQWPSPLSQGNEGVWGLGGSLLGAFGDLTSSEIPRAFD